MIRRWLLKLRSLKVILWVELNIWKKIIASYVSYRNTVWYNLLSILQPSEAWIYFKVGNNYCCGRISYMHHSFIV